MGYSYNKVVLIGNLTRDPELRYTQSGAPVCSLGLAMNRKYKVNEELREEVCFVDVTVWNKQGENCNQYLSKGKPVLVEGRLNFRTWVSQDGQKRSKLDVVAEKVNFLPSSSGSGYRTGGETGNSGEPPIEDREPPFPSDDEIPF